MRASVCIGSGLGKKNEKHLPNLEEKKSFIHR